MIGVTPLIDNGFYEMSMDSENYSNVYIITLEDDVSVAGQETTMREMWII